LKTDFLFYLNLNIKMLQIKEKQLNILVILSLKKYIDMVSKRIYNTITDTMSEYF